MGNKGWYESMKNEVMKEVAKAVREKADEALTEIKIAQMRCLD